MTRSANAFRRGGAAAGAQSGQAMVLFLTLAGVLLLGLLLLFNTGQAVNKKVTLTNTADAAAYSVAVQQARVMNFAAYLNRARIANEVAVAQMVSLWSWMNMLHTHTVIGHNFFTFLSAVPYVNIVARPLAQFYRTAEQLVGTARQGAHGAFKGVVPALDALNGTLATAAGTMVTLGAAAGAVDIATEVVKRNDPTAEIPPAGMGVLGLQLKEAALAGPDALLSEYRPGSRNTGMDRFRNVVMASRDRFSADRNDFLGIRAPAVKVGFEELGGTDLVDYDRWVAVDTLDLSVEVDLGFYELDWDLALGYGGAQALPSGNNRAFFPGIRSGRTTGAPGWLSEYHPGDPVYAQYNGATGATAKNKAARYPSVNAPPGEPFFAPFRPTRGPTTRDAAYLKGYQGLRAYHDVNASYARRPEGPEAGPMFTVYVRSGREHVRTAQELDIGAPAGGRLRLEDGMSEMTAVATAQTYFNRPPAYGLFSRMVPSEWNGDPQHDGRLEQGSLFSPYWQARLVETPDTIYGALGLASALAGGGA